ncbi:MAG: type II toxin-antitoxin system RelE/ParE family toxin [Oscillibacter sp.]|nr:type II toxin-antitoxin system RelE/ParE family toxin [Oscillibacter sp.]
MHNLRFRTEAESDIHDILRFYAVERNNPIFANRLADEIQEAVERLREYPYANPVLLSRLRIKHEYRKLLVRDYLIFYRISEPRKTVIIYRVLNARMDYERHLK